MQLGLLGLNHKVASLALREQVAANSHTLLNVESRAILVCTCNRTEIYFSTEDLAATHQSLLAALRSLVDMSLEQHLYTLFGADAFLHLALVTTGLDSALVFETEIQGQVKRSYEARSSRLPSHFHFAFQKALRIGKQVRNEWPLRSPALEEAVHDETDWHGKQVLLVGASRTNRKVARALRGAQLTLCNRSWERGTAFARREGIAQLPWEQLDLWRSFDGVICATTAPQILLKGDPGRVELLIDLSVPRNVDPALGERTRLRNIQELQGSVFPRLCPLAIRAAEQRTEELVSGHIRRLIRRERRFQLTDAVA